MTSLAPPLRHPTDEQISADGGFQPTARVALFTLALLLITNGPLFVCMPLTNDTALYDLQTRVWLDGGVLYRDVLEPNLPGVVWVHAAVRSLLGESSEAMRLFDLAVFTCIVLLLTRWIAAAGGSAAAQGWTATALFLFYLSIAEWNHCQRDVWLLAPALAGLHLRLRQTRRTPEEAAPSRLFVGSVLEGAVWGAAIWIKPMVIVPLLAAWIVSALAQRRLRSIACDGVGLLTGGVAVGGAGIAWLAWSGAWPYLWEMFVEWNPRYFAAGKEHWTAPRFTGMFYRFSPWLLLHLVAAPWAAWLAVGGLRSLRRGEDNRSFATTLLAAFYLAWLVQSFFLQHLFDYVHVPGILLAAALLAAAPPAAVPARTWRLAATGFLALALILSPVLDGRRLSMWTTCWSEGSTPQVRNRLGLIWRPDWEELALAADYLRRQNVRDGELTCYHNSLIYLYNDLRLRPSTRYVFLEVLVVFFPERASKIRSAVAESRQRFYASDLAALGLTPEELRVGQEGENASLPPAFPEKLREQAPWSWPIAFRAGGIVIHHVPPRREADARLGLDHVPPAPRQPAAKGTALK